MALIKKTLVPHCLKSPPLGLDIVIVICNVRILHISPEAYTIRHVLPLILICPYGLLTLLDKGLNTVTLDLRLTVDAQGLLYFKLYGKAMCIPTGLEAYCFTLHGMVSGYKILNDTSLNMSDVGLTVSRGRSVKECKCRSSVLLGLQ